MQAFQENAKFVHRGMPCGQHGPLHLNRLFRPSIKRRDDEHVVPVFDLTRENGGVREAENEMSNQHLQFRVGSPILRTLHGYLQFLLLGMSAQPWAQ